MSLPVEHSILTTLAAAAAAGTFLTILARKLGLPSIILLFGGGVLLGPEGVGIVDPAGLGEFLPVIVSLAVGIILFEGGLTLDLRGFQLGASTIVRLLSLGVVATWLGAAACVWLVLDTSLSLALLAGSLVIVTGPTVIGPLLKRIKIQPKLHSILHWEGVLIDAIGVFVAILCFEWVAGQNGQWAVTQFGIRILAGLVVGIAGGYFILSALRRRWVPANLLNAFVLGAAIFIFGLTETIRAEAGLLAVTLAGFIVGWKQPDDLRQIRAFKADITELLIGLLFILLAARLELAQFSAFGWTGALSVLLVLVVVRPLNVLASTWGTDLSWRERVFLSWVAPRGIVAASMASLFALALGSSQAVDNPRVLETFTYSVIAASVVLQGFSASWLAGLLGLKRPDPIGWLIVSADLFSRQIARFIRDKGDCPVVLMDTNSRLAKESRRDGFTVLAEDALQLEQLEDRVELHAVGHMLALTDNPELNTLLCQRWSEMLDPDHLYRWSVLNQRQPSLQRNQGIPVYAQLPRPSALAGEVHSGESRVNVVAGGDDFIGTPLAGVNAQGVQIPVRGRESEFKPEEMEWLLVLQREAGSLIRALNNGGGIDLDARSLDQLYSGLIDFTTHRHPSISKDESLEEMLAPEKLLPGFVGHGIAIPHLYSSQTRHRVCVLARLEHDLDVVEDKEPLRLAFFLVSPADDPEGHLDTLADIARICMQEDHRNSLIAAPTADAAIKTLRRMLAM